MTDDGRASCRDLAEALLVRGDTVEALAAVDAWERLEPDSARMHYIRGALRLRRGEPQEAIPSLRRARQLRPDDVAAATALASALSGCGQYEAAESTLRFAEAAHPDDADVLGLLCPVLNALNKTDEALLYGQKALALAPDSALAHNNMGTVYHTQWRLAEAERHFRRAVELEPQSALKLSNLAALLWDRGATRESLDLYERARELDPENPVINLNLAFGLMSAGMVGRAWTHYEFGLRQGQRRALFPVDLPFLEAGEAPDGKRILVRSEQGVGDVVLFASVLPDLIARAGHCLIECRAKLVPLLARSFPQATVLAEEDVRSLTPNSAERQVMLGSLPLRTRTTLEQFPVPHRYLVPDPARVDGFRRTLPGKIKVALLWRGGVQADTPKNMLDYLTLAQLAPVLTLPGLTFISAQYDTKGNAARQEIEAARAAFGVEIHVCDGLDPFEDLDGVAALLEACDLVLGPKTTTLHIAGGLGKPTFRWCSAPDPFSLGQTRCPFTPSVHDLVPTTFYDKEEIVRLLVSQFSEISQASATSSTMS